MNACQSYIVGETVCRDGFPIRSLCTGKAGCPTCGAISEKYLPWCMSDELPAHFVDERGLPKLAHYRRPKAGTTDRQTQPGEAPDNPTNTPRKSEEG